MRKRGKWGKLKERGRERLSSANPGLLFSLTSDSLHRHVIPRPRPLPLLPALPGPSLLLSSTSSVALLFRQEHAQTTRGIASATRYGSRALPRFRNPSGASYEASPAVNNRFWRRGVVSKQAQEEYEG